MAEIESAAASVISPGSSVVSSSNATQNTRSSIRCQIQVENWTRFALTKPELRIGGGEVAVPPCEILPTKQESMVVINSFGFKGCYGTVSWLLKDLKRRIVVLWSIPNGLFYRNWLGLGITTDGEISHHQEWYDEMYYKEECQHLNFKIRDYEYAVSTMEFEDEQLKVDGIMGSTNKCDIKITVRPVKENDLAPAIKDVLEKNRN